MPRGRLRPNVSSGWAEVYREAKAEAPYRDLCQAWERADLEQRKRVLRQVHRQLSAPTSAPLKLQLRPRAGSIG